MPRSQRALRFLAVLLTVPLLLSTAAAQAADEASGQDDTRRTVEGVILDAKTGEPVEGAEIHARVAGESDSWWDEAVTDEDGAYVLRLGPGQGSMYVRHDDYHNTHTAFELIGNETGMDVELKPLPERTARVTGVVLDDAGNPVEGAQVYLNTDYRPMPMVLEETAESHGDGAGEEAAASEGDAAADDEDTRSNETKAEPAIVRPMPEPGYPWENQNTETDEEGRFSFLAYPGWKRVRVEAENFAYETVEVEAVANETVDVQIEMVRVPDATATIEGRVVDADTGEPVANAWVSSDHLEWSRSARDRTDEDGRFKLTTLPGQVRLNVNVWGVSYGHGEPRLAVDSVGGVTQIMPAKESSRGYYTWTQTLEASEGTQSVDVELTPKPAPSIPVLGWVIDEDTQEGIPNAWVSLRNEDTGDWGRVQTDEDGSFKVFVRPGHHVLEAGGEGYLDFAKVLRVSADSVGPQAIPLVEGERRYAPCWEECHRTMYGEATAVSHTDESTAGGDADAPARDSSAPLMAPEAMAAGDGGSGSQVYDGGAGGLGPYSPDALSALAQDETDAGTDQTDDNRTDDTNDTGNDDNDSRVGGDDVRETSVPAPGMALAGLAVTAAAAVATLRRQR